MLVPAAWFIYNIYFHPLAKFPGPVLYRGSNIPKVLQELRGTFTARAHELHEEYGPVVRIAPWQLSFITADAWRDICTARGGREPMPLNPVLGLHEKEWFGAFSLLWLVDNAEHARHRRVLAPAFSDRSLREQEPTVLHYMRLMMQRLHERVGTPVDLCAWSHFATFDIIGDLTFGEPFNCLEDGCYHPWINFILSRLRMMQYGQIITAMGALGGALIKMLIPRSERANIEAHIAYSCEKVDQREARRSKAEEAGDAAESGGADRADFMTHILGQVGREGGMTKAELYANAQTLVMAGSETTATLLAAALFHLMRKPAVRHKLEREVRGAFATEDELTFLSVCRLPYLGAVVNESLRIQPPIPAAIHRFTPPGGAVISGEFVAGGADVHVAGWAANHSARNFRDPYEFVPERWLGDERYAADELEVSQPFSIGPRACIGRHLAMKESRLILAGLVWHFDMEMLPESRNWDVQKTFLLYEKGPLMARLTPVLRPTAETSGEKLSSLA